MDTSPIAVFDSGMGGLTAVRALFSLFPHENVVYLGDTGRVPYGTRSDKTITRFTSQAFRFLRRFSPKAAVVACGTASTVALSHIDCGGVPVVGVVRPSVRKAAEVTLNNKVGLIATPASVRSGVYPGYMKEIAPHVQMTAHHGRLLVPLAEDGRISQDDPVAVLLIREYMQPFIEQGVDTLILGCTHYPLMAGLMEQALGKGVTLINSGYEAVAALRGRIPRGAVEGKGTHRYYVTDDLESFTRQASLFLGQDISGTVEVASPEE
ncbi:MAG: glutamate racemase [Oscillospiraceae bacterium]|nr:glutamate racemase [Oscillospiraceae bacterium]